MKTINYTGSSKLIARIVNLLNRKIPLPLDGDGNPDWGTNGQVLSTNGVDEAAWVNQGGGGSGGHTIQDTDGSDMPTEGNLQFVGVYTEDDSANDRTKVNIVRQMTKAAMQALSSAEKEGFIDTTDEDDDYIPISAEDVKRGVSDVDADITALENGKVSKIGDTMTGRLNIASTGSNDWYPLLLKSNFANACYIRLYDKNNTELGAFGCNEANIPYFRDGSGVLHVLSMRKVTTLVNESVNLAQSGSKTYATLTTTYLSQFDEVTFLCNWGSPVGALVMTKAMISKTATVYGSSGAVGISSGAHYGSFTFGSSGMVVRNGSSSTMVSLLVEGITY